ncbi:hypothetical protein QJS04_geneDACA008709 [Acorus gramineus]|uniref:4a-hydroxytetrahydrobiopterin dehydratase n=1 Tax=Acorus gramineus TaxID=55184 RepID=A0AAV9AAZ8_ACOGR|nr:hypothetical protein QJS04_geneDACA008709 [Acorus gramineus]
MSAIHHHLFSLLPARSPPPDELLRRPVPFRFSPFKPPKPSRLQARPPPAAGPDLLGDFGARDPFPEEIESRFGEKVLGPSDTEHKILIPTLHALSLSQLRCDPVRPSQPPMPIDEAKALMRKIVGWRLVEGEEGTRIQCVWKVRDFGCGLELVNRIFRVSTAAGHYPNLHLEQPNLVRAEIWTASIGGLSINDFILAAKIDEIPTSDLLPKKRMWA